jgi:hypothetical protein
VAPLAQRLAGHGLEVALYDYVTSPRARISAERSQTSEAVERLR